MRKPIVTAALCLSALLAGCSSPPPLDPAMPLRAVAASQSLRLENASSRPIYYLIIERETVPLSNWAPCTSPDHCEHVDAHGETRVEYSDIPGYKPGAREAIVYWWHLVQRDGEWAVDHLRAVLVEL